MKRTSAIALATLLSVALAPTALAKDITVDSAGKESDLKTIQAALDAIPANNTEPVLVHILPGKYVEYLNVPKNKPHITFRGMGPKPEDTILSYHYKASDPKPANLPAPTTGNAPGTVGTTGSASVTINASDFTAENLTFENSAGDNVGQAVAIKTNGDRLIFRNCRFLGFQDTLYPAGGGRCYFQNCYITGDTDFIFGNATAVFDHCTINATDPGLNYYTAANTATTTPFGYVFLDCQLTAGPNVKPGAVFLGRPWQWDRGSKASVTFIRCTMGPHVNPTGWNSWGANETQAADNTRYSEFGSVDPSGKPIDVTQRVAWSHQLTAEQAADYSPAKILAGADHWNPTVTPTTNR